MDRWMVGQSDGICDSIARYADIAVKFIGKFLRIFENYPHPV